MENLMMFVGGMFLGLMLGAVLGPNIVYVIAISVAFICLLSRHVLTPLYVMFKQWRNSN